MLRNWFLARMVLVSWSDCKGCSLVRELHWFLTNMT